jgi:transposase
MSKRIMASGDLTIGLDLGDKYSEACVVDGSGEVLETFRVRTTQAALDRALSRFESARVVLEVGTNSPWVSRLVTRHGHEVIVANPRRVRLIAENGSKSDRFDAELLARLGRLDPSLLSPIVHRGEQAQRDLVVIRSRDGLVRARSQLINQVRGFAKSLGTRLPGSPRASGLRYPPAFAEAASSRS